MDECHKHDRDIQNESGQTGQTIECLIIPCIKNLIGGELLDPFFLAGMPGRWHGTHEVYYRISTDRFCFMRDLPSQILSHMQLTFPHEETLLSVHRCW